MSHYFIFLFFVFTLYSCSAAPNDIYDEIYLEEEENEIIEVEELSNLSLDELKEKATIYTFEDVQAITTRYELLDQYDILSELYADHEIDSVVWFKDFKNWKIEELKEDQIDDLVTMFYFLNKSTHKGNRNATYIDDDGRINNFTQEQFKNIAEKTTVDLCTSFNDFHPDPNYYPVEYITQLTKSGLERVSSCLTEEQILSLDKDYLNTQTIITYDGKIPFSPEFIKSLEDEIIKDATCVFFLALNEEQLQVLTPEQMNTPSYNFYHVGAAVKCFEHRPYRWAWFTPEHIKKIDFKKNKFKKGYAEALNEDQLKALSKEQLDHLGFRSSGFFSKDQLRVLKENGTMNYDMREILFYREMGPDVFTKQCRHSNLKKCMNLYKYLIHFEPEQFSSLSLDQALSLDFRLPLLLTPEQIAHFPYFVKILNFEDYKLTRKPDKPYMVRDSVGESSVFSHKYFWLKLDDEIVFRLYKEALLLKYSLPGREYTDYILDHSRLLKQDQIRAIPADQIKDFPSEVLVSIYRERFRQEEESYSDSREELTPIPFTPQQFAQMSDEQFKFILDVNDLEHELGYLTDEYIEVLSLDQINHILDLSPGWRLIEDGLSLEKNILDRKQRLEKKLKDI